MTIERSCEVAVLGAGLAGLRAATALAEAGVDILVVEARDRVGGRTCTERLPGGFVDHGGQWVSAGQPRIEALAASLGVTLFPTWDDGQTVDWRAGRRRIYTGMLADPDPAAEAEVLAAAARLHEMAATVPLDAPWNAPRAAEWDDVELHQWLRDQVAAPAARAVLTRAIEGVFSQGPGRTSLLAALFWAHSGDPLTPFVAAETPPDRRFDGGAAQLCEGMAARLGERVFLRAPVAAIEHGQRGVRVVGPRLAVSCRRAIVTVPLPLAARIRYLPSLPAARDHLTQRTPMGWIIKVHCRYAERFWREDGLSGQVTADEGVVSVCADNSPASGSPAILVGFIEGAAARRMAAVPAADRRAAVLADLGRYFGPRAARPEAYYEYLWGDDEFARGAEGGYWTQGIWTAYGPALRAPIGALHWAGTETSPVWCGKMEGAVRSGERVAAEVLDALGLSAEPVNELAGHGQQAAGQGSSWGA